VVGTLGEPITDGPPSVAEPAESPGGPLIGRAGDLARLRAAFAESRLVTVVGTGGVGKTRLALVAAAHRDGTYPETVALCELADVLTPDAVRPAVAARLGLLLHPGQPLAASLPDLPNGADLLIVLDNCEHVIDAAADIAADLLSRSHIRVLATSREPLQLPGERIVALHPLPVPDRSDPDAAVNPAVQLFLRRATDAGSDLALDASTTPDVVRLCRALDGLPLALEIAAARTRSMTVRDIADRMDHPFALLRAGTRRVPDRHRSLRSVFDWSWELLAPDERTLLAVLAVYPSGADLDAATAAAGAAGLESDDVVDLLDGLVGKSLLTARSAYGRTRYVLAQTLRAYGEERLTAEGQLAAARDAHADYFAELTRHTRAGSLCAWTPETFTAMALDFDNLRAALTWTLAEDETPDRTFALLAPMWFLCQLQSEEEIASLAARALRRWPEPDHPLWSEVAATNAAAHIGLDEPVEARQLARRAIAAATSPIGVAYAWRTLAEISVFVDGDPSLALEFYGRAEEAARSAGYEPLLRHLDLVRSESLVEIGRRQEALELTRKALRAARDCGEVASCVWGQHLLGQLLISEEPQVARRCLDAALKDAAALPYPHAAASAVRGMGVLAMAQGDIAGAAQLFDDAMNRFTRMGCPIERWTTVAAVLPLLVTMGRMELATALLREMDAASVPVRVLHAPAMPSVREALGADEGPAPAVLDRLTSEGLDQLFAATREEVRRIAAETRPAASSKPAERSGTSSAPAADTGELRRGAGLWQVSYAGREVHLPDLKGLADLAVLLTRPGREVAALDLATATAPGGRSGAVEDLAGVGDLGERLDASARAAYAARIRELQSDLDEADAAGDAERGSRVQAELDFLTRELSAAYGLHGPRRTGDPAEKARAAVTARIRAALAKIREVHPVLGRHLDRSIITGRFCSYRPEEDTRWTVTR
jgi:predicted ATPase